MKRRQLAAILFAVVVSLFNGISAYVVYAAEKEMEGGSILFSAELVTEGENPGLYGKLNYIPKDTWQIQTQYSLNGEDFYNDWELDNWDVSKPEEQSQLCIGINDAPLRAYQEELINSLYVRLVLTGYSSEIMTQPVMFTHGKTWPIPETPPLFDAWVALSGGNYQVIGNFSDFLPDAVRIRAMYSIDGLVFYPTQVYTDWQMNIFAENGVISRKTVQPCMNGNTDPLKSYLEGSLDHFYLKLEITKENGGKYDSETVEISHGAPQPMPEDVTVTAVFPNTMRTKEGNPPNFAICGKYQLTVREDDTEESIYQLLPNTLPIEIQINRNSDMSAAPFIGTVECDVIWKELPDLDLTAGNSLIVKDAAEEIVVPSGTVVETPNGIFILQKPLYLNGSDSSDEMRVVINVVGSEEPPDVSLLESRNNHETTPLAVAFTWKPSGASSIKAFSYVEGEEDWTEICELLTIKEVDAIQKQAYYGDVDILWENQRPYMDYMNGKINGFMIGIVIEGGTYDGEKVILSWPGDYNPPDRFPELKGSGGNENNAGSGGGDSNGSENNGGQRPNLPEEEPPLPNPTEAPSGAELPISTELPGLDNSGSTTLPEPSEIPESSEIQDKPDERPFHFPGEGSSTPPSIKPIRQNLPGMSKESENSMILRQTKQDMFAGQPSDSMKDTEIKLPKTRTEESNDFTALSPPESDEKTLKEEEVKVIDRKSFEPKKVFPYRIAVFWGAIALVLGFGKLIILKKNT